jgi:glycosyltransferase involved in cell wall biosynthesis
MASGLPLIVSDLQGLSETIEEGKNGFKITPGDDIALADKIQLLCSDIDLAKTFSFQSRKRALEKLSIENQISKVSQILQNES